MSRAYRISVKESETRELKGSDEICTKLELLDILPPEDTAGLLKGALKEEGFKEQADGTLTRQDGGLTVTVDPCDGTVSVKSEVSERVGLESKKQTSGYDDVGPSEKAIKEKLKEQAKADIDKKAEQETARLQGQATEALEKHLDELQPELGRVVNKVTREALKQKARSMGTVQEVHEDADGNMLIKVEV